MKNAPLSSGVIDNSITLNAGSPVAAAPAQPPISPPTLPSKAPPQVDRLILPVPAASENQPVSTETAFAAISPAEAAMLALSPSQRTAIQLLTSGHTLVDAATAAGVSRMTLYRWLKGDAAFCAAFNAWQKDVLDTARGRLLAMMDLAVTTVGKSMSRGDARTALKILGSVGLLDRAKPGSTDADEIHRMNALERKKAQNALRSEENRVEMDSALMP